MKILFISLVIVVLIALFAGVGYFLYQKNQPLKEINNKTNKLNPTLETFNYQIPFEGIKPSFSQIQPAGITSSPEQPAVPKKPSSIPPQSITPKPAVISQNYIIFYQNSINNLNKILAAINELQKTLIAIQEKYENGDTNALLSLISEGVSQNAIFGIDISNFKNSLDNWFIANDQTADASIKSKTNQTIEIGKDFSQSAFELSDAIGKILSFNGVGDINQLSQQLQTTVQKVSDGSKNLNESFTELNNLLSHL